MILLYCVTKDVSYSQACVCIMLRRWYIRNNLQAHGVTEQSVLRAYFLAAANIFEPNRAAERLGWARTAILAEAIASHLRQYSANGAADGMTERLISGLASHDWDWRFTLRPLIYTFLISSMDFFLQKEKNIINYSYNQITLLEQV